MSRNTHLPILPTPGMTDPRFTRLRFHAQDPANGTPAAPVAPALVAPAVPVAPAAPVAPAVDPAATVPPAPVPAAVPAPPAGAPAVGEGETGALDALPTWAQAELRKLRTENQTTRTARTAAETQQAALVTALQTAGLIAVDEATPDPAALAATAQEAKNEARAARVELAAYKVAGPLGADPAELLDRRSVSTELDKLDPTAADFDAQVAAVVKKAITDNPRLLAQAPVAGASSPQHPGGTGELVDIDAQIAAAEKAGNHQLAISLKLSKQRAGG